MTTPQSPPPITPDPDQPGGRPGRRATWLVVAIVTALVGGALLWFGVLDDGDAPSGSPSPSTSAATSTPTTTPSSIAPAPFGHPSAIWPFPGEPAITTPEEAARTFAVDYLGFVDPIFGEFQQGDSRSGEVSVQPRVPGPTTTIFVRQLAGDTSWSVIGSATSSIELTEPDVLAKVTSPVQLQGRAHAYEGTVQVQVRQDGDLGPIGEGFVTGGGDAMRPFEGSVEFETPGEPYGALILSAHSAEDGRIDEATVVRIAFRSPDIDAAACGDYPAPRPRATEEQMVLKVYFTCDADGEGRSFPVYRLAPRTPAVLDASLRALLAGPTAAEREAKVSSWFSDETSGMLRSVTIADGHAVVDFADLRPVIPSASSSAGSARLLAELDATVFQFRSVESVEYRIEGSCEAFNEWLQYGGCDTRTRPASTD